VVSLLDVLNVNAEAFARVVAALNNIITRAHLRIENNLVPAPELALGSVPVKGKNKKEFLDTLGRVIEACEVMKLAHTKDIAEYTRSIYQLHTHDLVDLRSDAHNVLISLYTELSHELFLHLDSKQAKLFSHKNKKHFGDEVAAAFPSTENDIHEAGNCLALERWPAAVFHCMRVLEIGLGALATKFGVTSVNWHNIIEECEAKIKKIDSTWGSDWKDYQKFYSEAARHFMFLKDALRNHIMHVRDPFDEGKALSVWQHTKEFMQQISQRLHE
jgi:hypothetical protein